MRSVKRPALKPASQTLIQLLFRARWRFRPSRLAEEGFPQYLHVTFMPVVSMCRVASSERLKKWLQPGQLYPPFCSIGSPPAHGATVKTRAAEKAGDMMGE